MNSKIYLKSLSIEEFKNEIKKDVFLLDTRNAIEFTQGFIAGFINIGLEDKFEELAKLLIPNEKNILLITQEEDKDKLIKSLTNIGFNKIIGCLDGGFSTWQSLGNPIDIIIDIEADEFKMDINYDNKMIVLDVRSEIEFETSHVQTAINTPLQSFMESDNILANIEEQDNVYIYCRRGSRSVIAASIFKKEGFHNIRNVIGGFESIQKIPDMPLVVAKQNLN